MSEWDGRITNAINNLTEEDRALFVAYTMRSSLGPTFGGAKIPFGSTIGTAIFDQKQWITALEQASADQEAAEERLLAHLKTVRKQNESPVSVTLTDKKLLFFNSNLRRYHDEQFFQLDVKNKSSKDISSIKGELIFVNIMDAEVGSFTFSYSNVI
ncbi:hypothetical protein [Glaciimonas immobilis]|uniref:Uncharacterized protein n=1 Tax=Glaciimonas immobilis TaxID=728004 RepID=A0A840RQY2_9BURK|nr:hypothetical protein [Glaciimonas immobilis]KAF3997478.1 hypothetical protein HAV38_12420 [Glaciimonas immobilis]MBB5200847.1 hypothetical protein [Glaciimonas immobilis]